MNKPTFADFEPLLIADNFRDFLNASLKFYYRKKEKVNYADFSRRSGFSSRSYLSELLSGKKGLSSAALQQIKTTLKLPRELTKILDFHAYASFPELCPKNMTAEQIPELAAKAKNSFIRKMQFAQMPEGNRFKVVQSPALFQVYAALGTAESGASLSQMKARTGLPEDAIEVQLQVLKQNGLVEKKGLRFFAVSDQMDFFGLSKEDGLCKLIEAASANLHKNVAFSLKDPFSLTFYTAFSVDSAKLPALREKLKEAVYGVLDDYQDDNGNNVRQLLFSFR